VAVEHIKVHGTALEGNLEGNAVDRDVFVFLPPGYAHDKSRRYPVVYALHGYSIGAEQWSHEIHVPQTIEGAFAQGAQEMIVVLPDSKTVHNGSMYSSSVTTGDFERFVSHDLVAYIDAHYRTIPERTSRGLVGHSMGGYGATRLGMKHSDVFGSLYIMSPCCLSPGPAGPANPEMDKALEAVKAPEGSAKLPFFARAMLAKAAAWSPDPKNPPLYLDLPTKDGQPQPEILAKWTANAPLHLWTSTSGHSPIAQQTDVVTRTSTADAGKHMTFSTSTVVNEPNLFGTIPARSPTFQNHVCRSIFCSGPDCQ
jgi:pimeloyl-ACP methyl ester carboxylesterase